MCWQNKFEGQIKTLHLGHLADTLILSDSIMFLNSTEQLRVRGLAQDPISSLPGLELTTF